MSTALQITPFMHVRDLAGAVDCLGSLGFETLFRISDYAYLERERAGLRMLESEDAIVFRRIAGGSLIMSTWPTWTGSTGR